MMATSERIAQEMAEVVSVLQAAGAQNNAFGGALSAASARMDQGLDPAALRDMVAGLAAATKEMAANNQALTAKLEETGREVSQMRQSLHEAQAEALTDALTGVGNRKAFDQTLAMRVAEAFGARTELGLLMCDIDHFKKFNDTWGHQTGDQVIRFVAATLKKNALGDMLAARYGGEEFALIMPRLKLAQARELAETIRRQVESKVLIRKSTGEDLGRISISIGLAVLRPGDTPATLLERADDCLYASKRGGRNRVTADIDHAAVAVA
jgi:diguanylate cyclase